MAFLWDFSVSEWSERTRNKEKEEKSDVVTQWEVNQIINKEWNSCNGSLHFSLPLCFLRCRADKSLTKAKTSTWLLHSQASRAREAETETVWMCCLYVREGVNPLRVVESPERKQSDFLCEETTTCNYHKNWHICMKAVAHTHTVIQHTSRAWAASSGITHTAPCMESWFLRR